MMQNIKRDYFDGGLKEYKKEDYKMVGLVMGILIKFYATIRFSFIRIVFFLFSLSILMVVTPFFSLKYSYNILISMFLYVFIYKIRK